MNFLLRSRRATVGLLLAACLWTCVTAAETNISAGLEIRIVEIQGTVEVSLAGSSTWLPGQTNQLLKPSDRLRTSPNSRVALRWSDHSVIPFGPSTQLEILPPDHQQAQAGLRLVRGVLSFFHRDKPGDIRVVTRGATAGIEGTEFVLAVNDSDRTTLSVIDGKVRFANEQAVLILTNGQQAISDPGQAPVQTPGFIANNVLQWCFYYPAVLNPDDLPLTADEQNLLTGSLAAYRSGDLLNALAKYPEGRQPASNAERIYYAALLLSVGQVEQTQSVLAALPAEAAQAQELAHALEQLIAAVKREAGSSGLAAQSSSALLAASYYEQSRSDQDDALETARDLARQATVRAPEFGFAWTRLAELEFSFGNTRQAAQALERGLSLSPRNAQALALKGFLLAADNKTSEALGSFDRALAIDSALANAWLGRGLCRIRRGDVSGGREDLMIAAALEPQRSGLRSYLGKAHDVAGDYPHAEKELRIAKQLDPNDPTPYLYSALVHQQNNQVNEAIRDLEKSQQLNDNRGVYRSQLLLNQDHAVRSANLAHIYADAGMTDVSMREASRAVTYDYANYSAHLFLAYSYEAMRDRSMVNLRYETPAFTEYYLANLLAPVDAGPLSPAISQNEYSRLFNQNHLGFISSTEYLSRGAWSQSFAQYGTFDTFNYSLEGVYRTDRGQRANNDLELKQLIFSLKQRITAQDHIYLRVEGVKWETGDLSQYYDPNFASADFRDEEEQIPNLTLGYHHEWSPGVHTLLLLGRHVSSSSTDIPNSSGIVSLVVDGNITGVQGVAATADIQSDQQLYSGELQQIFQQADHTVVLGALFQYQDLNRKHFATSPALNFFDNPIIADQDVDTEFYRYSIYGYESWQVFESLRLVGGLSYDYIDFPRFHFSRPFSTKQDTKDQVSPKAGLVWTPGKSTTLRAAYSRSLAGMSYDQSFRLEPTQVAGINQSYRSLISESLNGANVGASFETYGVALDKKFESGTYVGISGELLNSEVNRWQGAYFLDPFAEDIPQAAPNGFGLKQNLDYQERSIVFTANQLLDREWALGLRYRLTQSDLESAYPATFHLDPAMGDYSNFQPREHVESLLHQLNLHMNFNHASGFFSSFEAVWYRQENTEDLSGLPGDDFWHFNLLGGYRFWQRRARIEAGILNLSDQDYRLHPLVWHNDLPRHRTFVARFQFSF